MILFHIVKSAPSSENKIAQPKPCGELLTKEQLRKRLNLESVRKVEEMMKARMIPYLKLGHKTVRFDWPKVQEALAKFECKAVGQN